MKVQYDQETDTLTTSLRDPFADRDLRTNLWKTAGIVRQETIRANRFRQDGWSMEFHINKCGSDKDGEREFHRFL